LRSAPPKGCRAATGAGAQYVTSVGLNEWNALLGSGQPLGTLIWLEQDRFTDLAITLAKYWVSEGTAQGHQIVFVGCEDATLESLPTFITPTQGIIHEKFNNTSVSVIREFIDRLPRNAHLDKFRKKDDQAVRNVEPILSIAEEDEDQYNEEETPNKDDELTIAWQYRTAVQEERTGIKKQNGYAFANTHATPFCHSFDLSGRLVEQYPAGTFKLCRSEDATEHDLLHFFSVDSHGAKTGDSEQLRMLAGFDIFRRLLQTLKSRIACSPNSVIRLVLLNPCLPECAVYLPLLMSSIVQDQLPVVVLVVIHPVYHASYIRLKRSVADSAYCIKGFAPLRDPPPVEFKSLAGLLLVERNIRRPPAHKYGLKRDRRKLHLQMLHLPPEEMSTGGSSVSGGGARSGAGSATSCSSAIDF